MHAARAHCVNLSLSAAWFVLLAAGPLPAATAGIAPEFYLDPAPGSYDLLATWDLDEIDEAALKDARAQTVTLTASGKKTFLLDVHGHVPLR